MKQKNDIYFNDVPKFGDLYLEETLFEDECPMLFVLRNKDSSKRFISVCCDFRKEQRWIISTTSVKAILDLLNDKITIRDIFTKPNESFIIAKWERGFENVKFKECNLSQIDEEDLPTGGIFFEADGEFDEYISFLELLKSESMYQIYLSIDYRNNDIYSEVYNTFESIFEAINYPVNVVESKYEKCRINFVNYNNASIA